jgi:catechol 2,3-dioxygenase-like lactoylglutathione lyase family enzyme
MIKGINHITLSVSDLKRSFDFYSIVLGFKPLLKNSKSVYFLAGDLWFCLEQGPNIQRPDNYTHFAFSVDQKDFPVLSKKIIDSGAEVYKQNVSEGESLYFLDPDGYKLEIHVGDWKTRLEYYKKNKADSFEFF